MAFLGTFGEFIADRSEIGGFLRARKSRMLAAAAEQERALLIEGSLERWNEEMGQKLGGLARPDDRVQMKTLIKQGNLAYLYSQSMHPELRKLGEGLLVDVMKAERDFDVRQEAEARADAATQATQKAAMGEQAWKRLNEVADDLQRESLPFITQQAAYHRMVASAKSPSPAGDLALIFNYMKVLDPGSTVREGEAAAVQNAAGVPDILRTMYNMALRNGERLDPQQRADIVAQSTAMYNAARSDQIARNGQYLERARDGGVPAELLDSLTIPVGLTQTPQAAASIVPGGNVPPPQTGDSAAEITRDTIRGVGDIYDAARSATANVFEKLLGEKPSDKVPPVPTSGPLTRDQVFQRRREQHGGTIDRSGALELDSNGRSAAEALQKIEDDNARALEEAGRLYTTPQRRRPRR